MIQAFFQEREIHTFESLDLPFSANFVILFMLFSCSSAHECTYSVNHVFDGLKPSIHMKSDILLWFTVHYIYWI